MYRDSKDRPTNLLNEPQTDMGEPDEIDDQTVI